MALTKTQKQKALEDLKDKIARQKALILIGISGVKVKDLSSLRKKLKETGNVLKVAKKNLLDIALKEKKMVFDKDKFKMEIALAFGFEDEILPAKTVYQFTKESENLKILGGFIQNEFKNAEEIVKLAQLPSREELLAKVIWSIASPISGLVSVLQGNIKGLLRVLAGAKT
jgi:large subunit ribosomal protein L10